MISTWFDVETCTHIVTVQKEEVRITDWEVIIRLTPHEVRMMINDHVKPMNKYKRFLWEKQEGLCPVCHEKIDKHRIRSAHLHHDPPLSKGGVFIDYKGVTKNALVHAKCHKVVVER